MVDERCVHWYEKVLGRACILDEAKLEIDLFGRDNFFDVESWVIALWVYFFGFANFD